MKFTKHLRYGEPYWFSGIYKIVSYTFDQGYTCKPYYHVYYITGKNWGDYVGGKPTQHDKKLTFNQCVKLAENHAKTYAPTKKQIEQAEIAMTRWIDVESCA